MSGYGILFKLFLNFRGTFQTVFEPRGYIFLTVLKVGRYVFQILFEASGCIFVVRTYVYAVEPVSISLW